MTDTAPKKKSHRGPLRPSPLYAWRDFWFFVSILTIINSSRKAPEGTLAPEASKGTAFLDLSNPQQRVFKPAKYASMRKFVEESVSPNGQGYSSHWNDSTLIVINKVSEIDGK